MSLFSELKERSILLLLVLPISIFAVFIAYHFGGLALTSGVVLPLIVSVLTISKNVWSSDTGQTKVALVSIGAMLVVIGLATNSNVLEIYLEPLYSRIPALQGYPLIANLPLSLPLFFSFAVFLLLINWMMSKSESAMGKSVTPLDKEFPEKGYKEKLEKFAGVLLRKLENIDSETNWSSALFVPLEAEVEIKSSTKIIRRKTDLLTAIRKDQEAKAFLIIGEPGAGKSVALRKLCKDLNSEVMETGKVPVYINLREWSNQSGWSRSNPPTVLEFDKFVFNNLKSDVDVYARDFLNVYYRRMVEDGRFFFVLDSFDEIPAVLDATDNSWIIDELSRVIYEFLSGAHNSRGILASRPFRRPTIKFAAQTILEIKSLSERKIVQGLRNYPRITEEIIQKFFTERRDLLQMARNPFHLALIVNFIQDNDGDFPSKRIELYKNYINKRLQSCQEVILQYNLNFDDIEQLCQQIAILMFDSDDYGFEFPIKIIKEKLVGKYTRIEKILEVLIVARIGRQSAKTDSLFSFAHRRFAEYFFVISIAETDKIISFEGIPKDNKWREILVLYAELVNSKKAKEIAVFCWDLIKEHNQRTSGISLPLIHSVRFLRDAFRFRVDSLVSFRENLCGFICGQIVYSESLINKKIALEAIGLVDEKSISKILKEAFSQNNSWLNETAFRSCLSLRKLGNDLEESIVLYLDALPAWEFIIKIKDLLFIFRLSPIFKNVVTFAYIRIIDIFLIFIAFIALICVNPAVALVFILLIRYPIYFLKSFFKGFDLSRRSSIAHVIFNRMFLFLTYLLIFLAFESFGQLSNLINFELSNTGYKIPYIEWLILLIIPWYQIYFYGFKYKNKTSKPLNKDKVEIPNQSINKVDVIKSIKITIKEEISQAFIVMRNLVFNCLRLLSNKSNLWRILKNIGLFLVSSIIVLGIGILIVFLIRQFSTILPTFSILFISICFLLFLAYLKIYDEVKNRDFLNHSSFDRKSISEHFLKLKTSQGRFNFVRKLEISGIRPTGEWEYGVLPNVNDDRGSILLAKLEERWLNLDR